MPSFPENPPLAPQPPKSALAIIFLIVFTDFLGFGIIIPLLPFYVPNYRENALKVTFLFAIYSICQFIAAPILGALSDRFGRKPVLAISQVGSSIGYILLGVATYVQNPSTKLLVVYLSRIIDGLSGGNVSTAQAYISDVTTAENRAKGMGLLGAAFGIGFSAGPAIGGILGHYNQSWPAYAAAAFSGVAAILSIVKLPESQVHKPADVEAWLHPRQFLPVFRRPALVQLLFISFITMAAFVMMECTIGIYLNEHPGFKYSPAQIGWFFAYIGLIIIIVQGGLIGRLTKKVGEWPLAIIGPLLVALGMAWFIGTAWRPALLLLGLAGTVNAIGRSLQGPTLSALISHYSNPREQGVTFGLYQGLSSLARVFGPIIAGLVYPFARNTGQFITAAGITLAAMFWTASVRARYPRPSDARYGAGAG